VIAFPFLYGSSGERFRRIRHLSGMPESWFILLTALLPTNPADVRTEAFDRDRYPSSFEALADHVIGMAVFESYLDIGPESPDLGRLPLRLFLAQSGEAGPGSWQPRVRAT
jgi:hypothetical protein